MKSKVKNIVQFVVLFLRWLLTEPEQEKQLFATTPNNLSKFRVVYCVIIVILCALGLYCLFSPEALNF